jgi:hypothetical protein
MWGRPVIRPSDAKEVCQESAFLGNESEGNDGEGATTHRHQNQTSVEEVEEEHTPRTLSDEQMGNPPLPEPKDKVESGISPGSRSFADQTVEVERAISEGVGAGRPETPKHTGVPESPALESAGTTRPKAPPSVEVQDRTEADPRAAGSMGPDGPQLTKVQDRTGVDPGASTSGLRGTDSEAAPNAEAIPTIEESGTSRFRAAFEVLGRGLLRHPMEAIKNLIPKGFLAHVGTASPERIAQGILISLYQVNLLK